MIEVKYKVPVIGDDRVIEPQHADGAPIAKSAPLQERRASRRTLIGHFNAESQGTFRRGVALVKNLRHDLVAKIQRWTFDSGLLWRDQKAHKLWASCGLRIWFSELGDLVQLTVRGLLVDEIKERACNKQDWQPAAAPPGV